MHAFQRRILSRSILLAFSAPGLLACASAQAQAQEVVAAEAPALAAPAAEQPAAKAGGIETVVVTARRKKERMQDVPTAITAISAKEIENMKIETITDVGQNVPNVQVSQQGGALAPEFHVRGIANGSLNVQVDSGIGAYVDGVYLGRVAASAFEIADLAQIEVMRGPQGTLFGRNSTGGAINLITADPTGVTGINAEVGFSKYKGRHQKVGIDFPSVAGLAARLTVSHRESDGYVTNTAPIQTFKVAGWGDFTTSRNAPANDADAALLSLQYKGVDKLVLDYKFDYSRSTQTIDYRQILNLDAGVSTGFAAVSVPVGFGYMRSLPATFESPAGMEVQGHAFKANYAINDQISAKYIGAYREYHIDYGMNAVFGAGLWTDGTTFGAPMLALRKERQHQSSHELQLLGKSGPLDWIAGLFYFDESASNDNPVMLAALGFPGIKPGVAYTINPDTDYLVGQKDSAVNKSSAAYAHASWEFGGAWVLSGGLRHTRDKRSEHVDNAGRLAFGSTVILPGFLNQDFVYEGSHTDYDVSATFKFGKDTSAYAKYSTGYVSGGILMGISFLPETVTSLEAGIKSTMLDNRLRSNLAVFEMRRKNLQFEGFSGAGYSMTNDGTAKTTGLELELMYKPSDALTLNGSLGISSVSNSGQYRTFQPKQTASFGAEYKFARIFNEVLPTLRVDGTYMAESNRLSCPAGMDAARNICTGNLNAALDARAVIPAAKQLNARLSFSNISVASGTGKLSFWGRNLLDQNKSSYMYSLGGDTVSGIFQAPRTFGVDFAVSF
ncbi:TonB-dependent receptor [Pseudoduganella namucuonensis]|uniref:Iron complex outermembrane recepter protein n=1 Tax=Pseudoduganella namucuonensis TaxID=1035707 RepID=A0A1I7LSS7_9BURK|nr:TonB-dependent receptor [Pseudoduganella namucuonensis]SFV12620.1 iron complex outermembrane recepter protein [Pseudoduganella namucuonensis]